MASTSTSTPVGAALTFSLSERSRESIKTALAMTIAYAIALMMDWDRPYWAAFAVAFVSLTTVGQSVNKAALRLSGTLVGMVVGLTIIALSAQDRWLFIVLLSLFTSVCAYMMGGSKDSYFWQVSGFVTAIICIDGGPDPMNAFATAVMRGQETGMGILVYTLVSLFLWPNTSGSAFFASATSLISAQTAAFRHCAELSLGQAPTTRADELEAAENQAQKGFATLLQAAESDTAEVMRQKAGWRTFARQSEAVTVALQHWRDSLGDVSHVQLVGAFPDLERFNQEIFARLTAIANMQEQQPPRHETVQVALPADLQALETLSHYDRAGLAVARSHMQGVDDATLALFVTVARLRGFADQEAGFAAPRPSFQFRLPDPDQLLAAMRFGLMQWTAFLAVLYIGDLPGGFALVTIVTAIGIALVQVPGFKVKALFTPTIYGLVFASVIYIFVMPHLSNYLQLAPLIFVATFLICYLNFAPQQMLGRALGLALFSVICAISNEQSYNFLSVTTTAMMFTMLFVLLAAYTHFPISMRSEDVLMRMLKRFARSAQFLLDTAPTDGRYAHHSREIALLPSKLSAWAAHLNPEFLPDHSVPQIQVLISRLQILSVRLSQLTSLSDAAVSTMPEGLEEGLRSWRKQLSAEMAEFAEGLHTGVPGAVEDVSSASPEQPEERITDKLSGTGSELLDLAEASELYVLLGGYRGVAEALAACRAQAESIDWQRLREPRFG